MAPRISFVLLVWILAVSVTAGQDRKAVSGASGAKPTGADANKDATPALSPKDRKRLDEADALNGQHLRLLQQRKFAEAIPIARQVLAIREEILGPEHPQTAATYNSLGLLYQLMDDYARAEPLYRKSLAIGEKVFGPEHPQTALSYNSLGLLCQLMGDYARAEPLYLKSLAIYEKTLGPEHPQTALYYNSLAGLYQLRGDYARAEPLYRKSLAIYEKVFGQGHARTAFGCDSLGLLYQSMGDYVRAEPLHQKSLAICEKVFGQGSPQTALSYDNLGRLYQSMGDYARAEPLYQKSLAICEKVFGQGSPHTALSYNQCAVLYVSMGEYAKAEPFYLKCLAIQKKVLGLEDPNTAASYSNLGYLYQSMGDYARAEPFYLKSLAILEKVLGLENPQTAVCYNNLATLYKSMGDYARSEPFYLKSLAILEKVLGLENPQTAVNYNNLADLYKSMGDYARAEPFYLKSLAIHEKVLGLENPQTAVNYNNLAELYRSMGDYARAEPFYLNALAIHEKVLGLEHPSTAISYNNLAGLYYSMGDYARAEQLFEKGQSLSRRHVDRTSLVQSTRQQMRMQSNNHHSLDVYLSMCVRSGRSAEAVYAHVLAWKGSVLARQRALRLVADQPELAAMYERLRRSASLLAAATRAAPEPKRQAQWRQRLAELHNEYESTEREIAGKSEPYRAATEPVTPAVLRAALPSGGALVDFLSYRHFAPSKSGKEKPVSERRYSAFVVRPSGDIVLVDLGAASEIDQQIVAWRATMGESSDSRAAGLKLRRRLWEPLTDKLGEAKVVLISPDGMLGMLPFGALPGAKPDSYLIEERSLTVVAVPRLLPRLLKRGKAPKGRGPEAGLLVVGSVDYDADPTSAPTPKKRLLASVAARGADPSHFGPLAATQGEIATIVETFRSVYADGDVTALRGARASEAAFRKQAPRHFLLHVATHGFFAPEGYTSALAPSDEAPTDQFLQDGVMPRFDPKRMAPGVLTGLALAGANRKPAPGADDGILTAEEVGTMNLDSVGLTVLSACETGLGRAAGGEGLLGLQRAFQVAGARTTVASLWKVDDQATRLLMERFYRNMWEKDMGKLAALREAQLWMLAGDEGKGGATIKRGSIRKKVLAKSSKAKGVPKSDRKRLPPRYWAGFVLSGDWR